MRADGLIEFEEYLINPHLLGGAVIWSLDKAEKLGELKIAQMSLNVLNRWRAA